jgi:DNA-directed RNA polymerase subunit RPC12/RpoP
MMSSPSRREPVLVSTEFVLHRSPYHSMESVYYYCHICKQPFDYGESLRELDPEVKCPTCKDTFVERVVDRGTPQDTGDGVQSQMVPGSSVPLLREGGTGFIQPSQPAIPTSVITHPTRPGGSPINLSRREGSSINPTRPDGSSANLTRPEGPPINLTRPEGSSSLGGSNRQSPFPIEEMGAISQPVEESQPPHQPLLDPSGGVGRDVPRVQEDGEGMTSSQEHMDVGESVPPSTSLPREETVSPQEPTASGGSTHHTSTHFRDRERERRLAFEREREDMWARRRDRFFSPFDVSLSSCMLTSCGAELSYQSQVQL